MTMRGQLSLRADAALAGTHPGPSRSRLPFGNWNWRHYAFYLGVPAVIAVYAALNNWAVLQLSGYQATLLFYAGHAFVPWWTSALATYLLMRLLRPWRPPAWLLWILGSFLACLVILPYSNWFTRAFAAGWLAGDSDGSRASLHILSEVGFWAFTLRATVVWVLVNLLFDRFLGLPRFQYAVPMDAGHEAANFAVPDIANVSGAIPADASLRFLQRLPATVGADEVIALQAEQHYIRVHTASRSFMTLYRFSDAVAEMNPAAGRQVHRSYWVRTSAIKSIHRHGRKYSLELGNELQVPISAANRGLIRELAKTHNIPTFPPL
jgi:hypothetical protein